MSCSGVVFVPTWKRKKKEGEGWVSYSTWSSTFLWLLKTFFLFITVLFFYYSQHTCASFFFYLKKEKKKSCYDTLTCILFFLLFFFYSIQFYFILLLFWRGERTGFVLNLIPRPSRSSSRRNPLHAWIKTM